jgi:hypothetical protein
MRSFTDKFTTSPKREAKKQAAWPDAADLRKEIEVNGHL